VGPILTYAKTRCAAVARSPRFLRVVSIFIVSGYCLSAYSYFTTSGQNIVDRATRRQAVALHGIGLGCWLLPEGYMWGSNNYTSPRQFEQAVINLIGAAAADTFWNLYHWNFLVEQDIKDMRCWGVNAVRVALLGALLQPRDNQPANPPYNYNPEGWRLLDSLVVWCERAGMGVIWDMHAAPGGQNNQNISDADGTARLWAQPQTYWPRTKELWFKIAQRYLTYKCIIGYDLLNEPLLTNLGYNGALLRQLYVQLTDTIRTIDTVGIIFVEGQWWARDFSILEPLTWDKHLAIAFHEYPPVIDFNHMRGNANGTNYDWAALRTRYNLPLWQGETGEQGPPYTTNIQSTDFCNANNIGWSWWTHKKFNNSSQPWNCPKTTGFQTIINYWNNGGTAPSAANAKTWLFDQARRTNRNYCTFLPNMVLSLHPLDTHCVVGVADPPARREAVAPGMIFCKSNTIVVELAVAQRFSVEVVDLKGRTVFLAAASGKKVEVACRFMRAGSYVVRVKGQRCLLQQRVAVPQW
jgi:endoglucanase